MLHIHPSCFSFRCSSGFPNTLRMHVGSYISSSMFPLGINVTFPLEDLDLYYSIEDTSSDSIKVPNALPVYNVPPAAVGSFFVHHTTRLFWLLISVREEFIDDFSNFCGRKVVGLPRFFEVSSYNFVTLTPNVIFSSLQRSFHLSLFDLSIMFCIHFWLFGNFPEVPTILRKLPSPPTLSNFSSKEVAYCIMLYFG